MTLSMPNYVPAMLSRLCPSGCGWATSPATYTPPVPYPDTSTPSTLTTLVSPAEKTWIQQVVGSLLFYARALDLSVSPLSANFLPTNPPPPNTTSLLPTVF
jgi:hypothetical protein